MLFKKYIRASKDNDQLRVSRIGEDESENKPQFGIKAEKLSTTLVLEDVEQKLVNAEAADGPEMAANGGFVKGDDGKWWREKRWIREREEIR